jgi:acyl-coenzyme A synthetase/AMP-(fatty) acid ligase
VVEAAVVGKPDTARGMLVKPLWFCAMDHARMQKNYAASCRTIATSYRSYKYPREIEFVDETAKDD